MGVKNFMKFVEKYAPKAVKKTKIIDYKNKTIGIDMNLMIYKMIYAIRKNGYDLTNDNIVVTHIHSFLMKIKNFIHVHIDLYIIIFFSPKIKYYSSSYKLYDIL